MRRRRGIGVGRVGPAGRIGAGCCCWSGRATTAATRCTPGPCSPAGRGVEAVSVADRVGTCRGAHGARRAGGRVVTVGVRRGPTSWSTGSSASAGTPGSETSPRPRRWHGSRASGRRGRHPVRRRRRHRPSSTADALHRADADRHLRHPQDLPCWRSPAASAGGRRPARRPRARRSPGRERWPGRQTGAPDGGEAPVAALQAADVAARLPTPAAARRSTPAASSASAPARPLPRARVLSVAGRAAGSPGWSATPVGATRPVCAAHPEAVAGDGRVQAWVVGSGGGADAAEGLARPETRRRPEPVVVDADALAHLPTPLGRRGVGLRRVAGSRTRGRGVGAAGAGACA